MTNEKQTINYEVFTSERILKACRDSVNGAKEQIADLYKEVKSQGKQMDEVECAAKVIYEQFLESL